MYMSPLFDVVSCQNVNYTKKPLDVVMQSAIAVVVDMHLMPQSSISSCHFFFDLVIVTRGIGMIV